MNPWDRREDEDEAQFAAFRVYRDQENRPRKILRAGSMANKDQLVEWSKTYQWKERSAAYDAMLDQAGIDAAKEQVIATSKEIAKKHAAMLATAANVCMRELEMLLASSEESRCPGLIKPAELARLMDLVIRYERLNVGLATDSTTTEVTHRPPSFAGWPQEDLTRFQNYTRRAEKDGLHEFSANELREYRGLIERAKRAA